MDGALNEYDEGLEVDGAGEGGELGHFDDEEKV